MGSLVVVAGLLAGSNVANAGPNLLAGARIIAGAESATFRQNRLLSWKPLTSAEVPAGAEIRCDKSCTLQVDADNTIVLAPGASISVGAYFYVPLVANAPSLTPAHRIELTDGAIEAISPSDHALPLVISPGPEEHVALRNARAQIALKGSLTAVAALGGKAASVRSHGRPSSPRSMSEAPKWLPTEGGCPGGLSVTESGGSAVVGGCWDRLSVASGYRVELAQDGDFRKPITTEVTQVGSWSSLLGVGRYFARVRSIDADGLWSEVSETRRLAVIPCVMPPGATANMEARTLIVPQGREIVFGETNDLEMAMDKAGFSRAPKSITMDEGPEHALRFRLKDDPSSTSTVYIARRRALVADVRITPKKAEWPTDPVDVAVTIQDPSGQVDASTFEPRLQVLLGTTELKVQWTHRGPVWSAHLNPRSTGGPTVLRVIAKDEYGSSLGRNFLEIDEKQQRVTLEPGDGRRVAHN
jgi:hypothetical protein